jgi:coatomer subunit beta
MKMLRLFRDVIETLTQDLNLKLIVPTDVNSIDEDSVFLVANLYTKSRLGEDALINVSIEKTLDKRIIGTSIIRSKVKVKNIN